jgi:hypothetical protein
MRRSEKKFNKVFMLICCHQEKLGIVLDKERNCSFCQQLGYIDYDECRAVKKDGTDWDEDNSDDDDIIQCYISNLKRKYSPFKIKRK